MNTALIIMVSIAVIALAAAIYWRGTDKPNGRPMEPDLKKDLQDLVIAGVKYSHDGRG